MILFFLGYFFIPQANSSSECEMCQTIVKAIEKFVVAGKIGSMIKDIFLDNFFPFPDDTLEMIIKQAEQFCDEYVPLFGWLCDEMIESYLPDIVENIVDNMDPFSICQEFAFMGVPVCSDNDKTTTPSPIPGISQT